MTIRTELANGGRRGHAPQMVETVEIAPFPSQPDRVTFQRGELLIILGLYGRMVAAGLWRDYGISMLRDVAVFSVFRHTAERALYRIEKRPRLVHKQGQYSVIGMDGRILKRGHDLAGVLRVLEKGLIRPI
jgi:hypothetical protein